MTETSTTGSGSNLTTTVDVHIDITTETHWIISVVGSVIIILISLFIAVAFIYHVMSTKCLKKKRSRRDVNGGLVMILAIIAVVTPLFRYVGTLAFLFVSLHPEYENGCEIAYDICVAGFGLAILPNYAFLWARQRAFYGHPSLGHMFGTCVGIFSKISLALIVTTALSLVVLGIYPEEYFHDKGGCVLKGEEEQDEYRTYVYAVVMISSQLVLLGLFLHPIRLHAQGQKGMHTSGSIVSKSDISERSSDNSETTDYSNTNKSIAISTPDDSRRPSMQIETNETKFIKTPKQYRSQSLPNTNNVCTSSKNKDSNENSDSGSEVGHVTRGRSATVQLDRSATGSPKRQHSIVPQKFTKFTRKMRRTTMRSKRVYGLIRRILYLAIFSIITDLTIMLINGFLIPDDVPQTYAFVLYDFNLLINVITVVLSFENWRKMMTSPCQ